MHTHKHTLNVYIYIYIYIVIHRQICFVLLELFSVARQARFQKLGSKPGWHKRQSKILPLSHKETSASERNLNSYVSQLFLFTYIHSTATESSIHIYIYTHTHTHTYIYIYIYVCVCVCVYIYIYIYLFFAWLRVCNKYIHMFVLLKLVESTLRVYNLTVGLYLTYK